MKYRSWLVVPGNSEKRLAGAVGLAADQIVVDLDATVPIHAKALARNLAREWLDAHRRTVPGQRRMGRWVRINALDSGFARDDLAAVMAAAPDGIILPRAIGPESVRELAADIYELEQRHGLSQNSTRIMPVVGETPRAAMMLGAYLETGHQRLAGLTWNTGSLAGEIGGARSFGGGLAETFRFVRAQTLLTARAGDVMAVDAANAAFEDEAATYDAARAARADGFTGMFAVHPGQVPAINRAFSASPEDIEDANAIVALFDGNPEMGSLPHQGRMLDRVDLTLARRMLEQGDFTRDEPKRAPILRSA